MSSILLLVASLLFMLHLICENMVIFTKYHYASNRSFMKGMVVSHYFAIASRLFVSTFGIFIALIIEKGNPHENIYAILIGCAIAIASALSLTMSHFMIDDLGKIKKIDSSSSIVKIEKLPKIKSYESLLFGSQFAATSIAYALSFKFPDYRLTIISCVPFMTMLGTLVSGILIEPRYAEIIDRNPNIAINVCQMMLRARAKSYTLSLAILISIAISSHIN
jgi:hypothetical protein